MSHNPRLSDEEREKLLEFLRDKFPIGREVFTVLRHESRNKRTRWYSVLVADARDDIRFWDYKVAKLLDLGHHGTWGIRVPVETTDPAWYLIKQLGLALWDDGYSLMQRPIG